MSEFKYKSITTQGMELLSKALSGERIEFTKIEMGAGNFTGDIGSAEGLVEVKQRLPITKIIRKGSQVTLSTVLRIEDITSDYDWTEIGVYAKGNDGVEILYMYGHTQNSSFISKGSLNEKLINVTVLVSNAAEVKALIDDSMVFLTLEALKDHDGDAEAHMNIKNEIKEVKTQVEKVSETVGNINIDLTPVNVHTTSAVEAAKNNINATVEACKNNTNGHTTNEVNRTINAINIAKDSINNSLSTKANKYYKASASIRHVLVDKQLYIHSSSSSYMHLMLGCFECVHDGFISISATLMAQGRSCSLYLWGLPVTASYGSSNYQTYEGMPTAQPYNHTTPVTDIVELSNMTQGTMFTPYNRGVSMPHLIETPAQTFTNFKTQIRVSKGQTIIFSINISGSGSTTASAYINRLEIGYDEVTE